MGSFLWPIGDWIYSALLYNISKKVHGSFIHVYMYIYFSLTFIHLTVTAFLQILRHEILIQNQVLFIQPPVERVREHLIAELHIWISIITLLPRIQSSRYQVSTRVDGHPFPICQYLCLVPLTVLTYNLKQNKWNIWTTPPPISMMPKWCIFAPLHLHHCFGGWGGEGFNCFLLFCPRLLVFH